jgi:hypothetical protein
MTHSYPADLAEVILRTWDDDSSLTDYCEAAHDHDGLPAPEILETVLSTCYQASLLREEERPVRFRLILANAASFPAAAGPPNGLHRLLFSEPRPLSHHALRRLAPAVDFHRALGAGNLRWTANLPAAAGEARRLRYGTRPDRGVQGARDACDAGRRPHRAAVARHLPLDVATGDICGVAR